MVITNKNMKNAKAYWKKIVAYHNKCSANKKKMSLSMNNGHYSYNNKELKKYEKYFLNLNNKEYSELERLSLNEKNEQKRFYGMLGLHYFKDKKKVFKTLRKVIYYDNVWDMNNAGYFILPISYKVTIPDYIIKRLIELSKHKNLLIKEYSKKILKKVD